MGALPAPRACDTGVGGAVGQAHKREGLSAQAFGGLERGGSKGQEARPPPRASSGRPGRGLRSSSPLCSLGRSHLLVAALRYLQTGVAVSQGPAEVDAGSSALMSTSQRLQTTDIRSLDSGGQQSELRGRPAGPPSAGRGGRTSTVPPTGCSAGPGNSVGGRRMTRRKAQLLNISHVSALARK